MTRSSSCHDVNDDPHHHFIAGSLLEAAERTAAQRGVTLSVVVEDALRIHLAQATSLPGRPPFRLVTVAGRLVNPHTDLNRTSELLVADDEEQFQHERN